MQEFHGRGELKPQTWGEYMNFVFVSRKYFTPYVEYSRVRYLLIMIALLQVVTLISSSSIFSVYADIPPLC